MVDTGQILVFGEVPNIFKKFAQRASPLFASLLVVFYLKLIKKLLKWGLKNLVVIASFIFIFNVNFILQLPQTVLRF